MNATPEYNALLAILDRPIAFHRVFATITNSVLAGLMLSQAVYWQPRGSSGDGWFYKTQKEWTAETGMSRWEQEAARKRLLNVKTPEGDPIWYEDRRGVPAKLWYMVDIAALFRCISVHPTIKNASLPHTGMWRPSNQESQDTADKIGADSQTFYTETSAEITAKKEMPPQPGGQRAQRYRPPADIDPLPR